MGNEAVRDVSAYKTVAARAFRPEFAARERLESIRAIRGIGHVDCGWGGNAEGTVMRVTCSSARKTL